MPYKPTIGLEIHAELKTESKMFCGCLNDPDETKPNVNVCPVCMGHPGVLPVINIEAVRKVIKAGLALNCKIPDNSRFDRKNYFYPDLPKGYQISQSGMPLCVDGFLEVKGKKVRIKEIHLEEDTGTLVHSGEGESLVNYNRAGVPLMELVTEPDIESAEEAKAFAEEVQLIFRYLDISYADMERGQMRVEPNISVSKTKKLGTKVEIKNLNSFKAVERGVAYEIKRQSADLDSGKKIVQETRGWDDAKGKTISQRGKEEAHDYRYFPEPDLPPLHHSKEFINEIKAKMPELPAHKRKRFKKEYGIGETEIDILVINKGLGEYFEKAVSELRNWVKERDIKDKVKDSEFFKLAKFATNYTLSDLQGLLAGNNIEKAKITPENFAEFITLIYKGDLSSKMAKIVLEEMFKTGKDPSHIIEEKGMVQITDDSEIEIVVKDIIANNPKVVEDFNKGKDNALQFLVGQVMAKTKGKANPQAVIKALKSTLTK